METVKERTAALPLFVSPRFAHAIRDKKGHQVVQCYASGDLSDTEMAALIVKAVNSFTAHLATLAKFVRIFESDDPFDRDMVPLVKEAMSEARTALSSAAGTSDELRKHVSGIGKNFSAPDNDVHEHRAHETGSGLAGEVANLRAENEKLKNSYRCYSCRQVFDEDDGHGLAAAHFGSTLNGDRPKCEAILNGTATWGGGPHDPFLRVRKDHYDAMQKEIADLRARIALSSAAVGEGTHDEAKR